MNNYVDFLACALEGLSDDELWLTVNFVEDHFLNNENEGFCKDLRAFIDSEDWEPEYKNKSRAQKRRDDYLKAARRTRMAEDIFGLCYSKKGNGRANGYLRDGLPDGHTERLRKGKKAEHKRQRSIDKRETDAQLRQIIEDIQLDCLWLSDWLDCEYGWDY